MVKQEIKVYYHCISLNYLFSLYFGWCGVIDVSNDNGNKNDNSPNGMLIFAWILWNKYLIFVNLWLWFNTIIVDIEMGIDNIDLNSFGMFIYYILMQLYYWYDILCCKYRKWWCINDTWY